MKNRLMFILFLAAVLLAVLACQNTSSLEATSPNEGQVVKESSIDDNGPTIINATELSNAQPTAPSLDSSSTPLPSPTNEPESIALVPSITAYDCVPQNTQRDLAQLVRVIDGDTICATS